MSSKQILNTIILLSFVLGLGACSTTKKVLGTNKKIDYKSSRKGKSLEVPPDLSRPGRDKNLALPSVSGVANYTDYQKGKQARTVSSQLGVLPRQDKARFYKQGDKFWVVVQGTPEKIWPVVKEFWLDQGFILAKEDPSIGIMETDWAENRANIPQGRIRKMLGKVIGGAYSSGTMDRYRVRLERTADGSTEIYLSHKGMEEHVQSDGLSESGSVWKPRKRDEELEIEMIKRLMVYVGVDAKRAKVMLARKKRSNTVSNTYARMVKGKQGSMLVLNHEFDKSWRVVGLALDRTGFAVEDRNRSKGIYYVRYNDPDKNTKKRGLFGRMKFWKKKKGISSTTVYQVRLASQEQRTHITVLSKDGKPEKSRTGNRILGLLHRNLN
jgi:outer membrane protein assembly factor BamC